MEINIPLTLDIPDIALVTVPRTEAGEIIFAVRSTLDSAVCPVCGLKSLKVHGLGDAIRLKHLSIMGVPTIIEIQPKRFRCENCSQKPTFTQELPWYFPQKKCTKAYERAVIKYVSIGTVKGVAEAENVSEAFIQSIVDRCIPGYVDWSSTPKFQLLGIDEVKLSSIPGEYCAVIYGRTACGENCLLSVLPDRRKETVAAFLESIPESHKQSLKAVCIDFFESYRSAARDALPTVEIVADRFHLAKLYRDAIDPLRKSAAAKLEFETEEEGRQIRSELRSLCRKRRDDLTDIEETRLSEYVEASPDLGKALNLSERLSRIFDETICRKSAAKKIRAWIIEVRESKATCFDSFLKTLDKWWTEILNYFPHGYSSGWVEGLNTLLKATHRVCYGLLNPSAIFRRMYMQLRRNLILKFTAIYI